MKTDHLLSIAREAGARILEFYGQPIPVDRKADDSPLTQADLAAHRTIVSALEDSFPDIPIISEESAATPFEERQSWSRFWLVDPLDGTKDFIKQKGGFTVNIALIEDNQPAWGVVYAPAKNLLYHGGPAVNGAWKVDSDQSAKPITSGTSNLEPRTNKPPLRIVASRDHAGPDVQRLLEMHPEAECLSIGSSLKFCLVAEGAADVYLRDVPTMEWDTAAAHAICLAAAASLRTWPDLQTLPYNKADLRNPFLVTTAEDFDFSLLPRQAHA